MSYPVRLREPWHYFVRPERIELSSEDPQSPILSVKLWAQLWIFYHERLFLRVFKGDFVAEPFTGFVYKGIGWFDKGDLFTDFFDDIFAFF